MVSFGSKNRAIGVSAKNQVGRFLAFVRNSKSASANRSGTSGCKESWLAVVKMKQLHFPCQAFYFRNAALFCHAFFREMQDVFARMLLLSLSLMAIFSS